MAWTYRAGNRTLELTERMSGVGLMRYPSIKLDGSASMRANARRDGQSAGRDYMTGQVVSLDVEVRPDHRPVRDVWDELLAVWRGDEVRGQGGAYATLTSDTGRKVYGRPRPVSPDFEYWLYEVGRVTLDFECRDDLWYGPMVSEQVRFSVPEDGGFTFPLEFPLTFDSGPTRRNGFVTVPGESPAWPTFYIHGPVRNPTIWVNGVGELVFETTLAFDQVLEVNTRDGWVKRDGHPLPGALSSRGSRLSDMRLVPGPYEFVLGGYDPTGTGFLSLQVEPAYPSF